MEFSFRGWKKYFRYYHLFKRFCWIYFRRMSSMRSYRNCKWLVDWDKLTLLTKSCEWISWENQVELKVLTILDLRFKKNPRIVFIIHIVFFSTIMWLMKEKNFPVKNFKLHKSPFWVRTKEDNLSSHLLESSGLLGLDFSNSFRH